MARTVTNGLYALLLVILLVLFWGRLSHLLETSLPVDAAMASVTIIALIAVCAAFTAILVRKRLRARLRATPAHVD